MDQRATLILTSRGLPLRSPFAFSNLTEVGRRTSARFALQSHVKLWTIFAHHAMQANPLIQIMLAFNDYYSP